MTTILYTLRNKKNSLNNSEKNLLNSLNNQPYISFRFNYSDKSLIIIYKKSSIINSVEKLIKDFFIIISIKKLVSMDTNYNHCEIEDTFSALKTAAYVSIVTNQAPKHEIIKIIQSTSDEFKTRFGNKNKVVISPGDIIDCNFGFQFPGEISGYHTYCIVCDILHDSDMIYISPIIENQGKKPKSHSYLFYDATRDIPNSTIVYLNGIVLLDKSRPISRLRIHSVIGKASPIFFDKVLKQLASTFDFTHKSKPQKSAMEALMEVINDSLLDLDSSKPSKEQILSFLSDIGMERHNLVIEAFEIACLKNIFTLKEIVECLYNKHPDLTKNQINAVLRKPFKQWISKYPNLGKYKAISLIHLIKIFIKNSR